MSTIEELRAELTAARREYYSDLRSVRRRFGIIPTAAPHHVNPALVTALDALEVGTPEPLQAAIRAFRNLHRAMLKDTVWEVLERTKVGLQAIRETDPELFAERLERWNQASWLFTNFNTSQSRTIGGNYRKALNLLVYL